MKTYSSIADLRAAVRVARGNDTSIGCVMTMGALHAGHRALLDEARSKTEFVVATIFVNPTQFAPGEDLDRYPRPLESDLAICSDAVVDAVFLPSVEVMYPPGAQTTVNVIDVSQPLEGAYRPTHFDGVTTVVLKLLNIVQPDVAFFGQKDFQQCAVIRQMVADLDVPVRIETVPTVRDADGLALSSRNQYLSQAERQTALALNRGLTRVKSRLESGETDVHAAGSEFRETLSATPGLELDYAVVADPDTLEPLAEVQSDMVALVAAKVGTTRLIDNVLIHIGDVAAIS